MNVTAFTALLFTTELNNFRKSQFPLGADERDIYRFADNDRNTLLVHAKRSVVNGAYISKDLPPCTVRINNGFYFFPPFFFFLRVNVFFTFFSLFE